MAKKKAELDSANMAEKQEEEDLVFIAQNYDRI